jgi:hypothetical protein
MRLPKGAADAKFLCAFRKLELEVEQAMHVLDKESGKLLNYRQLLHHPKYSKEWSISSANEFGRLAQGVGGSIKNPTNIIRFIREDEIPKERRKDVTYGSFVCTVRPKAVIKSTILAKLPHQQRRCLQQKYSSIASYPRQEPSSCQWTYPTSTQAPRIYQSPPGRLTRRNHQRVQTMRQSHQEWFNLPQSYKRNVWTATGRPPRQRITRKKTQQTRILSKQTRPGVMET